MEKIIEKTKKHISSGAIVYRKSIGDIEVLAMYRKASNTWHLPKGTQESHESIEETTRREVREETGYQIELEGYLGSLKSKIFRDYGMVPKITHYFIARSSKNELQIKHDVEHDTVRFVEANKLKKLLAEKQIEHYEKEHLILEQFLKSGVSF
jgi:8-oxo-dGTP pyrophosphatase MutT (NUDIX family)